MAGKQGHGAVDLFNDQDPDELMRQGHRTERDNQCPATPSIPGKPIRAADDQDEIGDAAVPCLGKVCRESVARHRLAALVEYNPMGPFRDGKGNRFGLGKPPLVRPAGRRFVDFTQFNTIDSDAFPEADEARHIALDQIAFRPGLQPADSNQHDPQGLAAALFARSIAAPHLFQIVELTDIRPENMDDHVAGIDQDPITMRHALDPRRRQAGIPTRFDDAVGYGANMNIGATGRDNHRVCEGGFSRKIDGDDLFCLSVFQGRQHILNHETGVGAKITLGRLERSADRF
jgi:hypothetical protein